jgi:hypothetical protein
MKYLLTMTCGSLVSLCGACSQSDPAADRRALLDIYEAQRSAHFQQNAEMFLAAVDTGYLAIGSGVVRYRPKAEASIAVSQYFGQTEFDHVRDLSPPRVVLAPGGQTAWMIGEVEVRARQRDSNGVSQPLAFRAAWLDIYEKTPNGWRLVVRANTQRELS